MSAVTNKQAQLHEMGHTKFISSCMSQVLIYSHFPLFVLELQYRWGS